MVTFNRGDLDFILDQILLSEGESNIYSQSLALDPTLPFGIRTVSGVNNNLLPGQENFGATDDPFPKLVDATPLNDADGDTFDPDGPFGPAPPITNNDYGQPGNVVDADPRIISNLTVDQSTNNPAAVAAALAGAGVEGAEFDQGMIDIPAAWDAYQAALGPIQALLDAQAAAQTVLDDAITAQAAAADSLAAAQATLAAYNTAVSQSDLADNLSSAAFFASFNLLDSLDGTPTVDAADIAALNIAQNLAASAATAIGAVVTTLQSDPNVVPADLTAAQTALASADNLVSQLSALAGLLSDGNVSDDDFTAALGTVFAASAALNGANALTAQLTASQATAAGDVATATTNLATADADLTTAQNNFDAAELAATNAQAAADAAETTLNTTLDTYGVELESDGSLVILNVAPDEGLSAPFNSWFVLFGQFFDHGLDLVNKGGNGTVYVPLQPDDPLYDPSSPQTNFMVLTRATVDENGDATNATSPFVDQNQTYTSHESHQVFLRDYENDGAGTPPHASGKLIEGSTGGMATWRDVKDQAAEKLGILLEDTDVVRVPLLATDLYGNFIPGANGFPQIVLRADFVDVFGQTLKDQIDPDNDGLVEGDPNNPVSAIWAEATGHAFLDDIAHNAVPGTVFDPDGPGVGLPEQVVQADDDNVAGNDIATDFRGRKVAYDNELLDEHFIAGDGRVNENFGLTAVHHVFHSEHNRLVEHTKDAVIAENDLEFANKWLDQAITQPELDAINALTGQARIDAIDALDWNGERVFQAAKFGTEMQYQHLVFEEFGRKVQPQINVFAGYDITIDAKIVAEFAHAVYRYGHSQLRENVDVVDADGNLTEFGLIEAFLNPLDFDSNSTIDADIAAGAVVRGMTRQQGSEIDEFVTGALRNNLLGLPLDLATLNIARARETGVPTLNDFRSEMYSLTSDPKLKPYESWVDFAHHAKHELSVVNFIAAYGTHSLITDQVDDGNGGLREKTLEEKRDAAMELVLGVDLNGDATVPADRLDFLNATGAWTAENSGLNDIDLWIGGLAEEIEPFGGMLGSTFNFVFEIQLENLQDGDRFYYLTRTAGLHFLNQLESNSFAGLIQRNTDLGTDESDPTQFTTHLPGDIFALPAFILESHVANQQDYDPDASETDRPLDLGRDPQGNSLFTQTVVRIDADNDGNAEFLKYTGGEHVVLGGTNLNDHLVADIGDDTLWGDGGDDYLEGGDGADILLGGTGDDILVDLGGAGDNFQGGDGNDVIVSGSQEALILAGAGKDYVLAGQDLKETFGGEGDDFIQAGDGSNIVFGGEGDDWIEGGAQADLLQGDNGAPFQDSPVIGNDVIIGGGGNDDYDAESGDDIMLADPGITRHEGMLGFDWTTHKGDNQPGNSDFLLTGALLPAIDANRDRFDQVEGLSGWQFDDQLRGDDRTGAEIAAPAEVAAGEGGLGGHELRNFDLINGLRDDGTNPEALFTQGTTEFIGGNIILGGGGSDIIEGRGGDDVIDGDKWLNVRIEIRDANDVVLGSADSMTALMTVDNTTAAGASLVGKTINEMMLTRELNPGMLYIVREILDGNEAGDVDIAQFSGARSEYLIDTTEDELGFITVSHIGGDATDGVDRIRNIEALQFADAIEILDPNIQNTVATGQLAIAETTPEDPPSVGDTFTIGIGTVMDPDGVPPLSEFNIVWQVEATFGANDWEPIEDPLTEAQFTGLTFTPTPGMELEGLRIRATASFTGVNNGIPEFVVSAPTAALAAQAVTVPTNGDDLIIGTVGNDGTLANPIDGLAGDDEIRGLAGNDVLAGGPGEDLVDGGDGNDILFGNGGADELFGGQGQDELNGGAGDDLLDGGTQADILNGNGGDDELFGGNGNDILDGGAGDDFLDGGNGNNDIAIFQGNLADATFEFSPTGNIEVTIGATTDEIVNIETLRFDDQDISLLDAQIAAGGVLAPGNVNGGGGAQILLGDNTAQILNGDGGADIILGEGGADTISGGNGADILLGGNGGDTINGDAGADFISGGNGGDTLNGGGGADIIQGDSGNDTINGNAGNDTIVWNIGDGQDVVNGGGNGALGDTFQINGSRNGETYKIYALTDPNVTLPIGLTLINPAAAIAVTYDDGTGEQIIGELTNIEEITLNTDAIVASVPGLADVRGDNVEIIGDFSLTGLNLNTITINGSSGNDVVDISGLNSDHRIVFNSMGGDDTLLGNLRPQDIIELAPGQSASLFNDLTIDGMTTRMFSTGQSITFTAGLAPIFVSGIGAPITHAGSGDGFSYTSNDLAELLNLVRGIPSANSETNGSTGIRDLEGTGNNLANPNYGSADQPFIRLTEARYGEADGDGNLAINPIFQGLDPRNISNILGHQEDDVAKNSAEANIFFMAFGQYFDHGLDFLPKGGNGTIAIGSGADDPADLTRGTVAGYDENGVPQHLNKASPFVDQNQAYGSNELVGQFLREGDGEGGLGARLLSGGVDPSNPEFRLLPTLTEAILHHWENNTLFKHESLPGGEVYFQDYYPDLVDEDGVINAAAAVELNENFMGSGFTLIGDANGFINILEHYVAGDLRANENYTLTSIHTIWARNHNYHVDKLEQAGFAGTAEETHQAAKIANESEYQQVVYNEFADYLLGGMKGSGKHGFDEYNPNVDASISHEFAAAVYRVGHSLIGQNITVLDENGNPVTVPLFDAFLNPTNEASAFQVDTGPGGVLTGEAALEALEEFGYVPQPGFEQFGVNSIIGGIVQQQAEEVDFNIVDAVRNDLVRIRADLFAFNVARGWDVGLGTLNQVKADLLASNDPYIKEAVELSGEDLTPYASWEDFQARNGLSDEVIAQFKQAYPDLTLGSPEEIAAFQAINDNIELVNGNTVKGIDRVDLWVGGLAEEHINGGMVGATFWVVLHDQFDRLQEGDRHYYLDRVDDFDFYETLDELSFSEIVARNTGLEGLPSDIFRADEIDDNDNDGDSDTSDNSDDDSDTDSGSDSDGGSSDVADSSPMLLVGSENSDALLGGMGGDSLAGMAGNDTLVSGSGDDTLTGGEGDDTLSSGEGDDMLFGDGGNDTLFAGAGNDVAFGGSGDDRIFGQDGDDLLDGGEGDDLVDAGDGDDVILASRFDGNDVIIGGAGTDTYDLSAITDNVNVDLGSGAFGSAVSGQLGSDQLRGIDNVIGGAGNDNIVAGSGINVMAGGLGDDTFVFNSVAQANGDTIADYGAGDSIDLSGIASAYGLVNDSFELVFDQPTFTAAGQVMFRHEVREDGEYTVLEGNVDENLEADFRIDIAGRHTFNSSDFG